MDATRVGERIALFGNRQSTGNAVLLAALGCDDHHLRRRLADAGECRSRGSMRDEHEVALCWSACDELAERRELTIAIVRMLEQVRKRGVDHGLRAEHE